MRISGGGAAGCGSTRKDEFFENLRACPEGNRLSHGAHELRARLRVLPRGWRAHRALRFRPVIWGSGRSRAELSRLSCFTRCASTSRSRACSRWWRPGACSSAGPSDAPLLLRDLRFPLPGSLPPHGVLFARHAVLPAPRERRMLYKIQVTARTGRRTHGGDLRRRGGGPPPVQTDLPFAGLWLASGRLPRRRREPLGKVGAHGRHPPQGGEYGAGRDRSLPELVPEKRVAEVFVAIPNATYQRNLEIVELCRDRASAFPWCRPPTGAKCTRSTWRTSAASRSCARRNGSRNLLRPDEAPLRSRGQRAPLLALSPVYLMLAMIVKYDSPGPVIFRQRRVGKGGVEFDFYKIPLDAGRRQSLRDDPPAVRQSPITR